MAEHGAGAAREAGPIRALRSALHAHEQAIEIHERAADLYQRLNHAEQAEAELAAAARERDHRDRARVALTRLEQAG